MLVIEDAEGPTSIAGIMGGARSEVNDGDHARADGGGELERAEHPAHLDAAGLRTEASGRFEKGLSPEQAHRGPGAGGEADGRAVRRAAGGRDDRRRRPGPGGRGDPAARGARRGAARRCRSRATSRPTILEALGFGVAPADDGLDVTVPHWRRNDVTREADLVEEVGRIWGYEKLPITLPSRRGVSGRLEPEQRLRRRAEDALVGAGVSEILGWSFAAPALVGSLGIPDDDPRSPRRAAREPDVRGPVGAAHAAARPAARQPRAQPRARQRGRAAVAVRRGLPGARGAGGGAARPAAATATTCPASTACRPSASTSARCSPAALRPASWRDPEPAAGRLLRRQGRARAR